MNFLRAIVPTFCILGGAVVAAAILAPGDPGKYVALYACFALVGMGAGGLGANVTEARERKRDRAEANAEASEQEPV